MSTKPEETTISATSSKMTTKSGQTKISTKSGTTPSLTATQSPVSLSTMSPSQTFSTVVQTSRTMTTRRMSTAKLTTPSIGVITTMYSSSAATSHGPMSTFETLTPVPENTTIPVEVTSMSATQTPISLSTHTSSGQETTTYSSIPTTSTFVVASTQTTDLSSSPYQIISTTQVPISSTRIPPATTESPTSSRAWTTRLVSTRVAASSTPNLSTSVTSTLPQMNSMPMMTNILRFSTQESSFSTIYKERYRRPLLATRGKPRNKQFRI